jgi:hypothetical protein
MTSILSLHSAESATYATFLINIFSAPGAAQAKRDRNFHAKKRKTAIRSVYG